MTNGSILNWMKARVRGSNEFRSERRRHCKRPQPPIPALAQDDAILYRARRRDIQRETASPLFPSSPRGGRTTSPTHIYEEISYRRDYSAPSDSGFRASVNIDNLMFDEAKTFGRFLIVPMKPDSDRGVQPPAVNRKLGYRDVTSAATGSSDDYEGESSCGSSGCGETPRCRQRLRNGAVYNCSRTFPSPPTTTSATTTTADDSGFYSPPETRRYSMHESAPSRSYLRMLERNEAITTPTSPPRRPAHRHHQVSLDHEPLRATTSNGYRLPSLNETTLPFGENGSYYRTSSTARPNRKTSGDTPTIHASGLPKAPPPLTSNRSLESPVYPTTPSTGCSSSQASSPNYDLLNRCSPVSATGYDSCGASLYDIKELGSSPPLPAITSSVTSSVMSSTEDIGATSSSGSGSAGKEEPGFLTDAEVRSLSLAERMSCRATAWPRGGATTPVLRPLRLAGIPASSSYKDRRTRPSSLHFI